jgi:hypothetical protein
MERKRVRLATLPYPLLQRVPTVAHLFKPMPPSAVSVALTSNLVTL